MVQGLAFLSKKSWHTKNFANQEKVWLAEEQKRAEEQKTKELARQIQQEREEEELDKAAGVKQKRDRGIDWMYEGGNAHSEVAKEDAIKEAEEYLLGKECATSQPASGGHFNAEDKNQGIHAVMKSAPVSSGVAHEETSIRKDPPPLASNHLPSVHDRNESFRMRYEDPMFDVSQRAREKQEKHDQTKALYERVTGNRAVDHKHDGEKSSKAQKHAVKEKKRHKSHKRKDAKRRRHDDNDDKSYKNRHTSHSQSPPGRRRSPSPVRTQSRRYRRSRSYSHSEESSVASNNKYSTKRRRNDDNDDRSYRKRRTSRSESPPGRNRSPSHVRAHSHRYRRSRSDSEESSVASNKYSRSPRHTDDRYTQKKTHNIEMNDNNPRSVVQDDAPSQRYGLIGSRDDSRHYARGADALGPDRDLLETKRQLRDEERRLQRERASTRRHRTPQERETALRTMEMDAQHQRDLRDNRATRNAPNDSVSHDDEGRRRNPTFLHDARRTANGMQGETDRMRQNKHSNQRLSDSDNLI